MRPAAHTPCTTTLHSSASYPFGLHTPLSHSPTSHSRREHRRGTTTS
jgi:hypothetical protein